MHGMMRLFLVASMLVSVAVRASNHVWAANNIRTLTWVKAEDAPTLDPHAASDGHGFALLQQIYEPLLQRDAQGKTIPALAETWNLTSDPNVWDFRLRANVTFHDGTPLTADDVVFSIERARQNASEVQGLLAPIESVAKVDAGLVRIKTKVPTALLPAFLTHVLIMSKAWATAKGVAQVPAPAARGKAFTSANANGTGPFELVSREAGVKTVMQRNDAYWARAQGLTELNQVVFRPIKDPGERVQAFVSGEVDFLQDVPVGELQKLQLTPGVVVNVGPENRSVFLGLNVGDAELASSNEKGRNPFSDKRVRQAISMAINRQQIQRGVMAGQAIPTGIIVPSGVNGYNRQLDQIPPYDVAKAKALIAEAGYPEGFSVRLDCSNGRYMRDEAICQALVGQLALVGIKLDIGTHTREQHIEMIRKTPPPTDFYLMGWSASLFDSQSLFASLYMTRGKDSGASNATRYSNPEVDRLTKELLGQTDFVKRNQTIGQLWRILSDEVIYIPLHLQTIAYAMKADIDMAPDIEDLPKLKFLKVKRTQ